MRNKTVAENINSLYSLLAVLIFVKSLRKIP